MSPIQIFSTLFICQQLWGMWNVHFLIVFIHICNLRGLYVSWYSYLHICFVCTCVLQIMGKVLWHGRWGPFSHGEAFHWYGPKTIFAVCILLYLPQKHFFNMMNFVGIASHIKCTFLFDYSIHFHVYMLISVYVLIFLHIFSGNAWNRLWMKRYGMTDQPPSYLTEGYSDIFVRWAPPSGSDIVWNWHLCQMFEYF